VEHPDMDRPLHRPGGAGVLVLPGVVRPDPLPADRGETPSPNPAARRPCCPSFLPCFLPALLPSFLPSFLHPFLCSLGAEQFIKILSKSQFGQVQFCKSSQAKSNCIVPKGTYHIKKYKHPVTSRTNNGRTGLREDQ